MVMTIRAVLFALLLATPFSGAFAQKAALLSGDEILSIISGKTRRLAGGEIINYYADGRYQEKVPSGQMLTGKWTTSSGQLCVHLSNGRGRCDSVYTDQNGSYVVTGAGFYLRLMLDGATPSDTFTLNECDQSISYTLFSVPPDVPQNMRAFSGVWRGKSEIGRCIALIVERVQSTGAAQVVYLSGAYAAPSWGSARFRHYNANIEGSRLIIVGSIHYEFVMQSTTQLSGTAHTSSMVDSLSLTRLK